MIETKILAYLEQMGEPVATVQLAEMFGSTSANIARIMHMYEEPGTIKRFRHGKLNYLQFVVKGDGVAIKSRYMPAFKPLITLPSPLGTREGSNDHLQHKSKHI